MKRRTFLYSGAVAISALAAWQLSKGSDEETIAMVVRRRLDYLKLEPDGLRKFAHDMAQLHVIFSARMRALSSISPIYTRFSLSAANNSLANLLRHGEDRIVSSYLISSDFFINGTDESRVVNYLGMIDPLRACGNPFARSPA
ncbi:MAG: hypothetical protein AB7U99_11535 [Steroidobacteraceae bacterium]